MIKIFQNTQIQYVLDIVDFLNSALHNNGVDRVSI